MRVRLISHTPEPERLCAAAAKLCHEPDETPFNDMYRNLDESTITRLLRYIIKMGHESVIEHATFTFAIEGVSRALTHQLVRHRMASYSQQSQRYVTLRNYHYVTPESIASGEFRERYEAIMEEIKGLYSEMLEDHKVRPEDARFILPNATTTKIVVTMNARSLRNFFHLRLSPHAQWEIRALAKEMLTLVMDVAPRLFQDIADKYLQEEE